MLSLDYSCYIKYIYISRYYVSCTVTTYINNVP